MFVVTQGEKRAWSGSAWQVVRQELRTLFGLAPWAAPRPALRNDAASRPHPPEPAPTATEPAPPVAMKWRRHPALLSTHQPADTARAARRDAVRGLFAARSGALNVATTHFARAAACPEIDLATIPGFWQLDRAAMLAAVEAYEQVERFRDAAALAARIRTELRPRILSPASPNVRVLPRPERITSGS